MKYKTGDYLSSASSVLLKVVAALDGEYEIYGVVSIKKPTAVQWFTAPELKHEQYDLARPNLSEFHEAKVGDLVSMGQGHAVKILARQNNALLLSQAKRTDPFSELTRGFASIIGEQDAEMAEHLHTHDTTKYLQNAADDWYDQDVMALMNWKLVKE